MQNETVLVYQDLMQTVYINLQYNKLLEKLQAKRIKEVSFKFLLHKERGRMIFQTIYLISWGEAGDRMSL